MTLKHRVLAIGMTIAGAFLGAGVTIAAGALILGLGSGPARAQAAPPDHHGQPMSGTGVTPVTRLPATPAGFDGMAAPPCGPLPA
ncbi:hypothetical protein M4578_16405 [Salipiger sp. P9]|uniref:hypothetical protein n=1 Tax=Salipiger pentaromativorans TaxID=2943193 RepID=UPI0021575AB8|nr:hypothetical protein [Salipiger pentaromativorans]MCR8549414.1 hypothetical protein [Salipiger pentaromativorans]